MPSQAPPPASRTARSTPKKPPPSKAAPKRPKNDEGTKSSPVVVDSDDEFALQFQLARKRNKSSDVSQHPSQAAQSCRMPSASQTVEDESSDDEPLITRVQAMESDVVKDAVPAGSRSFFGRRATDTKSSTGAAEPRPASQSALITPVRPSHNKRRIVDAFSSPLQGPAPVSTPSPFAPFSQASFPLYGEQTNLKSAFESVKKFASKTPAAAISRPLKAAEPVSFGDFAAGIGPERVNLSSTLENLSRNRVSSATSRPTPATFVEKAGQLEDPCSSPPRSAISRGGQAQNQSFPVCTSKKLKPAVPGRKSSTDALAYSPAATASPAQASTPGPSPFASNSGTTSSFRRRVPTPERLFTNMSVKNINKLILTMPRVEAEEARRGAKKTTRTTVSLKGGSAKKSGLVKKTGLAKKPGSATRFGSQKAAEQYQDIDMTEDDNLGLIDVEAGAAEVENQRPTRMRVDTGAEVSGESDGTLIEAQDESLNFRAAEKTKKTGDQKLPSQAQVLLNSVPAVTSPLLFTSSGVASIRGSAKAPVQISSVQRAARATPTSSVVDLTEDEPSASAPSQEKCSAHQSGTKVASPAGATAITQPAALASAPTERPEYTKRREEEFLKGFNSRHWPGGFFIRDTLLEVNAALHPFITRFKPEEGERHLHSLAEQGKLAIRHELVYHIDGDPGPDTPHLSEVEKSKKKATVRKIKSEFQESPYKDVSVGGWSLMEGISNARFNVFMHWLNGNVRGGWVFNNDRREDTLANVYKHLNEYLSAPGEKKLSLEELAAAFTHLREIGDVAFEGELVSESDVVRFLYEEEKKEKSKAQVESKKRRVPGTKKTPAGGKKKKSG